MQYPLCKLLENFRENVLLKLRFRLVFTSFLLVLPVQLAQKILGNDPIVEWQTLAKYSNVQVKFTKTCSNCVHTKIKTI